MVKHVLVNWWGRGYQVDRLGNGERGKEGTSRDRGWRLYARAIGLITERGLFGLRNGEEKDDVPSQLRPLTCIHLLAQAGLGLSKNPFTSSFVKTENCACYPPLTETISTTQPQKISKKDKETHISTPIHNLHHHFLFQIRQLNPPRINSRFSPTLFQLNLCQKSPSSYNFIHSTLQLHSTLQPRNLFHKLRGWNY